MIPTATAQDVSIDKHHSSKDLEQPTQTRRHSVLYDSIISFGNSKSRCSSHKLLGKEPEGTWFTAAFITIAGTAQPPFLTLPFALAQLGWVWGLIFLLGSGLGSCLSLSLLALLHHEGGIRYLRYRELSTYILGKDKWWSAYVVSVFQFAISFGIGPILLILIGQILDYVWELLCSESVCDEMNLWKWTLVGTGLAMIIAQTPHLEAVKVISMGTSVFTLFYTVASLVMCFTNDNIVDQGVSYQVLGSSSSQKFFNAMNGIGIIFFAFGNSVSVEIQATLKGVPPRNTTERPMLVANFVSLAVIMILYILIAVVGYYAYGNAVPAFLLTAFYQPKWLAVTVNILAVVQCYLGMFIYNYPLYEAVETAIMTRNPNTGWIQRQHDGAYTASSFLLRLITRTCFVVVFGTIAAALPFFTSIMGVVGAVSFTPLTYVLPVALYMTARGKKGLKPWQWWCLLIFAIVSGVVGLFSTIGAMQSLIVSAKDWDFFSST